MFFYNLTIVLSPKALIFHTSNTLHILLPLSGSPLPPHTLFFFLKGLNIISVKTSWTLTSKGKVNQGRVREGGMVKTSETAPALQT